MNHFTITTRLKYRGYTTSSKDDDYIIYFEYPGWKITKVIVPINKYIFYYQG